MFQFTNSQLIFRSSHTLKNFHNFFTIFLLECLGLGLWYIDLAKPKSGACNFFFLHFSRAQRLELARTRIRVVRLGAQCTDHWTTDILLLSRFVCNCPKFNFLVVLCTQPTSLSPASWLFTMFDSICLY